MQDDFVSVQDVFALHEDVFAVVEMLLRDFKMTLSPVYITFGESKIKSGTLFALFSYKWKPASTYVRFCSPISLPPW